MRTWAPWMMLGILCMHAGHVRAQAHAPCKPVDRLSEAAALLLLSDARDAPGAIDAALLEAESDQLGARALWLPTSADAQKLPGWLAALAGEADAPIACGRASNGEGTLVLAVAVAGGLAPVDAADSVVRGWLAPGFDHAELVIAAADRTSRRLPVTAQTLRDGFPLSLEWPRPLHVQLVASGPRGPRPIAQRTVSASPAPDRQTAGQTPAPSDRRLAGMLNRLRRREGLQPLRRHRLLREAARTHAHGVCTSGRVAHLDDEGADPEQRVRAAGISARLVGETVARAGTPNEAFQALLRSPSHLATMLDRRFTDAGVAYDIDARGRACVVVVLAAWPRFVGRVAAR